MKNYVLMGLIIALIIWFSMMALIPSVDPYSLDNPFWNGLSLASKELKLNYINVNGLNGLGSDSIVFIVGPIRPPLESELEIMKDYVYGGGFIIIMDEYGYMNDLIKFLGLNANVSGFLLRDPLYYWRSSTLPIVNAYIGNSTLKIYLNYASTINHIGGKTIASSSYFSYLDLNNNGIHEDNEPTGKMDVAVLYNVGGGRILIISDSDILINSMINQGDNLNFVKSFIPSQYRVYLLEDFIAIGPYTTMRRNLLSIYTLLFHSSIKYPFTIFLILSSYFIGRNTYLKLNSTFKPKRKYVDVGNVVKKHPGWNINVLKKIAEEMEKIEGFDE
ncbi:MAG: DUF4350 domain-containing protein [Candidatus Methanomethylicia archaeon]